MSKLKLVSTVKFTSNNGNAAKYEIYYDEVNAEYQAEVSHLTDVVSSQGGTITVWCKTPNTIYRLPGNTISDLEDSCKNNFEGR
ncbi:TPA: hypothetical protein ACGD64_000561 [Serratia marcescens]